MVEFEPDEPPWTEEQWERFFERSDARAARFGELFETLLDHPDRDRIVAREMGWDHVLEWLDRETEECEEDAEEEEEDEGADSIFGPVDSLTEAPEELDAEDDESVWSHRDELNGIPAYQAASDWGLRVCNALRPLEGVDSPMVDELVYQAMACLQVSAKIAGGHGMGYDDDMLCGNIVCCRRALKAADESLEGLAELAAHGLVAAETIDPLVAEGEEVRQLVQQRIEELRERVWWA